MNNFFASQVFIHGLQLILSWEDLIIHMITKVLYFRSRFVGVQFLHVQQN